MFRRKFLQLATFTGVSTLGVLKSVASGPTSTVTYHVKGFSCITCATGLDTLLSRQRGVLSSKSTYPGGIVTVTFNPEQMTEKRIEAFIQELGFTVAGHAS